jgi:hypothetical protein
VLQQRSNTFAQTIRSRSFFACDKAADHTFRIADNSPRIAAVRGTRSYLLPHLDKSPIRPFHRLMKPLDNAAPDSLVLAWQTYQAFFRARLGPK